MTLAERMVKSDINFAGNNKKGEFMFSFKSFQISKSFLVIFIKTLAKNNWKYQNYSGILAKFCF